MQKLLRILISNFSLILVLQKQENPRRHEDTMKSEPAALLLGIIFNHGALTPHYHL